MLEKIIHMKDMLVVSAEDASSTGGDASAQHDGVLHRTRPILGVLHSTFNGNYTTATATYTVAQTRILDIANELAKVRDKNQNSYLSCSRSAWISSFPCSGRWLERGPR